jgi:hypothetical protein
MSLLVKGETDIPKSLACENPAERARELKLLAQSLVKVNDQEQRWEGMLTKEVPQEIIQHVLEELAAGKTPYEVRMDLGISKPTAASWKKIMAAVRAGTRIDSVGYFRTWLRRNETLAQKLYEKLEKTIDEADGVGEEFETVYEGKKKSIIATGKIGKDFGMLVDALNRLQQGTVKMGRELGIFSDPNQAQGGGGGGVTIVVNTNVPTPTPEQVEEMRAKRRAEIELRKGKDYGPPSKPEA